ncbi:hypothetical protein GCM10027075_60840 [Streptomyces heilongjiangensis]
MDGALANGEVDVVVGHHAGESLGDTGEFDGGRLTVDRRVGRRAAGRVDGALSWGKGVVYARSAPTASKGATPETTGYREEDSPYPVERT